MVLRMVYRQDLLKETLQELTIGFQEEEVAVVARSVSRGLCLWKVVEEALVSYALDILLLLQVFDSQCLVS